MSIALQCLVLMTIVLVNGLLAFSEMALVSSRKMRLQAMVESGVRGAARALELSESPTRLLASVQICITILGIAAGAYGGANMSEGLENWAMRSFPLIAPWAHGFSVGIVVAIETILMFLIGELLPKRLAMYSPEKIAATVAPFIHGVGVVMTPLAHVLGRTTDRLIAALPVNIASRHDTAVAEHEFKMMVEQGTESGVLDKQEESMIKRVLQFGDLKGSDVMTPRTKVIAVNLEDKPAESIETMLEANHSYYPVYRGSLDNLIGVVSVNRVYSVLHHKQQFSLEKIMAAPLYLPDSARASRIIELMKIKRQHLVVLIDEFGGFAGIVTATDLMEAVVGEVPGSHEHESPKFVRQGENSWLVDGLVTLFELEQHTGFVAGDVANDCQTLGGLVMRYLDSIPHAGQFVCLPQWKFEVMNMDGNRIDKVLVSRDLTASHEGQSDVGESDAHLDRG